MNQRSPIGKQTALTIAAAATGLTLPSGAKVQAASVQVFTAPIRFWVDGSTPTATAGHRADVNEIVELEGYAEVANFLAIREASTSATLEITYYL